MHFLLEILPIPQLAIKQLPRSLLQEPTPNHLERTYEVRIPKARSAEDVEYNRPRLHAGLYLYEALSEFEIWRELARAAVDRRKVGFECSPFFV